MKALFAVLVVALAPAHVRFAVLGVPVSMPGRVAHPRRRGPRRGRDRVAGRAGDPPVPVRALAAAHRRRRRERRLADLGPRQAAVLAHLAEHPGLTATELARAFGIAEPYKQLAALQQKGLVVGAPVWHPDQGRNVAHWHVAPPGSRPAALPGAGSGRAPPPP